MIPRLETRTRLVFLQHPREGKVAIGTARMAHLALPSSELHEGVSFPGLEALAADPSAAVLFPGGPEVATAIGERPRTLIIVDGTWPQAQKIIRKNPVLARMRRLGLRPDRPSAYRIRREPRAECLATVEAVAAVLAELEEDGERFAEMLRAFTFMVERQLECARTMTAPRRRTGPVAAPGDRELAALRQVAGEVVLLHGEANAHGAEEGTDQMSPRARGDVFAPPEVRGGAPDVATPSSVNQAPELVHLVACRPGTGERFEAFVAPRRALGARTAHNLGVEPERLLGGETVPAMLRRLEEMLGPRAQLCGWGHFAGDLLAREGLAPRPRIDLRSLYAKRMPGRARGLHRVAGEVGAVAAPAWAAGRAGRMMAQLEAVYASLLR